MTDSGRKNVASSGNSEKTPGERLGAPPEQNASAGRQLHEVCEALSRKRALENEAKEELSSATKLLRKAAEEGQEILIAYQTSGELSKEEDDKITSVPSPSSNLTFLSKKSESDEDLNDEEVALLMGATPIMQGNQSEKNSPAAEQDSAPQTSDEASATSERNPSPNNESIAKPEDAFE